MDEAFIARLMDYSSAGMVSAFWAQQKPDAIAIWDRFGTHSYKKINANSNRLARLFRDTGLKPGDSVALFCSNRAEFVEALNASRRSGFRITPVNWHLATDEIAYILNDCEAKALIAETKFDTIRAAVHQAPNIALKLSVGGQRGRVRSLRRRDRRHRRFRPARSATGQSDALHLRHHGPAQRRAPSARRRHAAAIRRLQRELQSLDRRADVRRPRLSRRPARLRHRDPAGVGRADRLHGRALGHRGSVPHHPGAARDARPSCADHDAAPAERGARR